MAIEKPFQPWTKGDDITATRLNEMQARPIVDVRVGKHMRMTRTGNSVTLDAIIPDTPRYNRWLGYIVAAGPNAEADYDDGRYWVQRARLDPALAAGDSAELIAEQNTGPDRIVTATNFAENTAVPPHSMNPGQEVEVITQTVGNVEVHFFWHHPSRQYGTFVVNLAQSGGADGTATTTSTYTYDVTDLDDNPLSDTPQSPVAPRFNGAVVPATIGLGYYNEEPAFKLLQAFEVPETYSCPEPP